jgi:lysophospholipase L1-like esterase
MDATTTGFHSNNKCAAGCWVAFGDSLTEGMTYPLWFSQSLARVGRPTPEWVNAGVGGNTSGQMLARLDRDVLAHSPQFVFFNCGINDLMKGEEAEIASNVETILARLKQRGISCCVNSTPCLAGEHVSRNEKLIGVNALLREKAAKFGFPFANVFDPFLHALKAGQTIHEADHVHLNQDGYAIYVTALLKTLAPGVSLSVPWDPQPERGILPRWKVSVIEGPAQSWIVNVPDTEPVDFWWKNQERKRGFVLNLKDHAPEAESFLAQGTFHLDTRGSVLLKVGGQVTELSLDGEPLPLWPSSQTWGIHDGARTGQLAAGDHELEVKVGDAFFVAALPIP